MPYFPRHESLTVPMQGWTDFLPTGPFSSGPAELVGRDMGDEDQCLPIGTRLGEFEIRRVVGAGGFGIVYEAWDHSLERSIALKEFMPCALVVRDQTTLRLRSARHRECFTAGLSSFVSEARSLASFEHSALVKVHRYWEANGTGYMAMPLYDGPTLKQYLRDYSYTVDDECVLSVLGPLTEALDLVHRASLIHRDISPDNIILIRAVRKPVLLDFGAARRVIGALSKAVTVILKPNYAPVEQYGELPGLAQGPWTDVYSLAATLHFAIAGEPPPLAVGRVHEDTYAPLAQAFKGRFSARILQAIDQGLAVLPKDRFESMGEFRQALGLAPPRLVCFRSDEAQAHAQASDYGAGPMPPGRAQFSPTQPLAREQFSLTQPLARERWVEAYSPARAMVERPGTELAALAAALTASADPAAFAFPRPGDRLLGRFVIRELVIYDGAQQGFRALDERRKVDVLLQVLSPLLFSGVDGQAAQQRLAKRCALCSGLNHSVWSPTFDLLAWNDARLIVSEFRAGTSLRASIQEAKRRGQLLALGAVHQLALALGDGLQALHRQSVHAGLSPDAIVAGPDGHYRVLGIGLGGVFTHEALRAAGGFGASQAYQAPEGLAFAMGAATGGDGLELDGRADQYALAAIVFELLAGQPRAQASGALHLRDGAVPVGVSQAVSRAMSPNRDARFESVGAFLGAWVIAMRATATTVALGATAAAATTATLDMASRRQAADAGVSTAPHPSRGVDVSASLTKPVASAGHAAASDLPLPRSTTPWLLGVVALASVFAGLFLP